MQAHRLFCVYASCWIYAISEACSNVAYVASAPCPTGHCDYTIVILNAAAYIFSSCASRWHRDLCLFMVFCSTPPADGFVCSATFFAHAADANAYVPREIVRAITRDERMWPMLNRFRSIECPLQWALLFWRITSEKCTFVSWTSTVTAFAEHKRRRESKENHKQFMFRRKWHHRPQMHTEQILRALICRVWALSPLPQCDFIT